MGMPEETEETLQETYNMIKEIDVDKPIVTNLIPFPGTKLFEQAVRDNLFVEALDLKNFWRMDSFYYTDNKQFFIKPYKLSLEDLHNFRQKFDNLIEKIISRKAEERKEELYARKY